MSAPPRGQAVGATAPSPQATGLKSLFAADPDMAELIDLFVGEMPERVATVERLWGERSLEELRRAAHQLKGAGGGYGYPRVSDVAGKLEDAIIAARRASQAIDEKALASMKQQVDELIAVCRSVRAR